MVLLSLVIPCFNEEAALFRFHAAVRAATDALPVDTELVFIDDGSADGTPALLRELAAADGRARCIFFSRNFGKEAAILAGLRAASGDAVVIIDADLQHPPTFIAHMLELHALGYDQVVARRTRTGDGRLRTAAARLYYRTINAWADVELVDGAGDFRLLSRRAVDALLELGEYNRFSKGLFAWIGLPTVSFDYENVTREHGTSTWSPRKLVNYGFDGLISFNNRPLRAAIYLGLALTAAALCFGVWTVGSTLLGGGAHAGYTTIVAVVTGMGGLELLLLGVIGEYVGRIYYETKRRPHYVVKEVVGSAVPEARVSQDLGRVGREA